MRPVQNAALLALIGSVLFTVSAAAKSATSTSVASRDPTGPAISSQNGAPEADKPEADNAKPDKSEASKRETQLLWLNAATGYHALYLTQFEAETGQKLSAALQRLEANGPGLGLGFGLRFVPITLGVRGGLSFLSNGSAEHPSKDLKLWSIAGEIGFRFIPGGRFEPYLILGGGYSVLIGSGSGVADAAGSFEVRGPHARAGLGLDYFASELLSFGLLISGEALFLTRPGVSASDLLQKQQVKTIGDAVERARDADDAAAGVALSVMVGPGLHFD